MKKHQKHPKLVKAAIGNYGRNEWAIHGTNCSGIQNLAKELIKSLKTDFNIGYIDTDHKAFKEDVPSEYLDLGAEFSLSDKRKFQNFESRTPNSDFAYKFMLQDGDILLLNGNHHTGQKQIVFLDESKIESLERNSAKLTDIQAFIYKDSYNVVPTHIVDSNSGYRSIPVFAENDIEGIAKLIANSSEENKPPLNALVLTGGKSTRMGQDKSQIEFHGKAQSEYIADLLEPFVENVYISCRPEQENEIKTKHSLLFDRIEGMGPYGGIISAFMSDPNKAWLVIACDLPLLNKDIVEQLIASRNTSKVATAFNSPQNEFPEPLITIWEPRSYMRLLQFMTLGFSCPRKVLINSNTELIQANNPSLLMNVNTPEDLEQVKSILLEQS
jgi:molybdenum cofactor guanylyltransferase